MFWRWLTGRPSKALSSYGNAYKLNHKHPLSRNTSVYRFALPTEAHVLGLPVGQHLMLGLVGGGKDTPSRPYTPITIDRTTKGTFDLLIKTYPTGRLTPWIDQLKLGDEAFMSGPFGGFTYEGRGAVRINDEITGGSVD
ncbi:hypothetical protein FOZ61_001929 [Perkinsus olseni]|uniref:FAD-binding FR-type domain-containing protein n=1 Tax=Perkinsus olseni TaxID=32597 RepID=A0A7J6LV30_PEROL|nr:hypothetical protein FOZ61_001929 [Perkinsus olseni]